MSDQNLTVEDVIRNSDLCENMQEMHIEFCRFLKDNEFAVEPEDHTEADVSGWKIIHMTECVGHMNFANVGIWIDTCDFGENEPANDDLKAFAWAHVRTCDHFSSGGNRCGCGRQPGFSRTIFGKQHDNLCFALLEFLSPDVKTLGNIKKLMLLLKQNKRAAQRA